MLFIGLDLAWRAHNCTGAVVLRNDGLIAEWGRFEAGALPANRRLLAEQGVVRGEALVAILAHHFGFVEAALIPQYAIGRYVCEVFPHPAYVSLFT